MQQKILQWMSYRNWNFSCMFGGGKASFFIGHNFVIRIFYLVIPKKSAIDLRYNQTETTLKSKLKSSFLKTNSIEFQDYIFIYKYL